MAVAAAGLVRVERADDDRLARIRSGLPVDETLGGRGGAAAAVADGLELVDELGPCEELGHGPERLTPEVLVEAGGDHADAAVGERERGVDDRRLEELRLVDADDLAARATSSAQPSTGTADMRTPAWLTTSAAS